MSRDDRDGSRADLVGPRGQADRRRLLKLGIAAIPVIVTLRATPVHAMAGQGSLGLYSYGNDESNTAGGDPMGGRSHQNESFGKRRAPRGDPSAH